MSGQPLLVAVLLSAVAGSARADFPLLGDVVLDLCGDGMFKLDPSSPCHYHLLGFSMAWSECSAFHELDMPKFKGCLQSCVADGDQCHAICGGGPQEPGSRHCYGECATVVQCVKDGLSTSTGLVSAENEVLRCFNHVPAYMKKKAPSFLELGGASRRARDRKAQEQPLVDFEKLFPKSCEVHAHERPRLEVPEAPDGHGKAPIHLPEDKPLAPFFPDMRKMIEDREASATTFSPSWHSAHMNVFSGPEAKPDPGPPLPEAVQTPNLQSYFETDQAVASPAQRNIEELKNALRTEKTDKKTKKATKTWW